MERNFYATALVKEIIRIAGNYPEDDPRPDAAVSHLMYFLVFIDKTRDAFEVALSLGGPHFPLNATALLALAEALATVRNIPEARKAADLFYEKTDGIEHFAAYPCYGYTVIAHETENLRDIEEARRRILLMEDPSRRAEGLIDINAIHYRESDIRHVRTLINALIEDGDSAALDRLNGLVRITWNENDFIAACKICQEILNSPHVEDIKPPQTREEFRKDCIESVVDLFEECTDTDLMERVAQHVSEPVLARAVHASLHMATRLSGNSPDAN